MPDLALSDAGFPPGTTRQPHPLGGVVYKCEIDKGYYISVLLDTPEREESLRAAAQWLTGALAAGGRNA